MNVSLLFIAGRLLGSKFGFSLSWGSQNDLSDGTDGSLSAAECEQESKKAKRERERN